MIGGNWTPSFYGYDGHDNVRFLTNSAGTITDSYDFDAFGMPIKTTGTTPNVFLYSGERMDNNIGLYDLRARYYNQATGRFWARDPEEGVAGIPLTFNPYVYVSDDPVDEVDPTGRFASPARAPIQPTQPRVSPGAVEYGLVIAIVSFSAIAGSEYLAQEINCAFEEIGGGLSAAVTSNLPGIQDGPCKQKARPKCKDEFPKLINVNQLPSWYAFHSEGEAYQDIQDYYGKRKLRKGRNAPAKTGPCSIDGPYTPGWHIGINFAKGGKQAGDLVGCPCCEDTSAGPIPTERWGVIYEK